MKTLRRLTLSDISADRARTRTEGARLGFIATTDVRRQSTYDPGPNALGRVAISLLTTCHSVYSAHDTAALTSRGSRGSRARLRRATPAGPLAACVRDPRAPGSSLALRAPPPLTTQARVGVNTDPEQLVDLVRGSASEPPTP